MVVGQENNEVIICGNHSFVPFRYSVFALAKDTKNKRYSQLFNYKGYTESH